MKIKIDYEAEGRSVPAHPAIITGAGISEIDGVRGFHIDFNFVRHDRTVTLFLPPSQVKDFRSFIDDCVARFPDLFTESP